MSVVDNLTYKELREIAALFAPQNTAPPHPMLGQYVIVRTYSAGVHIGFLKSKHGTDVILESARRIWKWSGAFTLSEIAVNGVGSGSRISTVVPIIALTQSIEIIPVSDSAKQKLDSIHE